LCAVPLGHVIETMRPLTIEPLPNVPSFVLGIAIIRGDVVPVVDAALLLGGARSRCERFVTLAVGRRVVALAVGEVIGVRGLPTSELEALPELVAESAAELVAAIAKADADLVFVLRQSRILPDPIWAALDGRAPS
jgi:purine-binding chemotaxis protein CheW